MTAVESSNDPHTEGSCDTLYYDGACPLCVREIEQLRNQRGAQLAFVDIHSLDPPRPIADEASAASRPDKDQLLRTLHLQRADGHWLRGADANVAAWEGTAQARLWGLLRAPVIRHAVDLVYGLWAHWRYRRLYGAHRKDNSHAAEQR